MRGSQTEPEKIEQAKAVFAKTNNYTEAARVTGLPKVTAYDNIKNADDFEQYRMQVRTDFIVRAYNPMMELIDLLTQKINELKDKPNLNSIDIKELTGALKDLKTSMENVGNTINIIGQQNNTQNNYRLTEEDKTDWAIKYLEGNGCTITK